MVLSPLSFLGFKHCAGRATELVMQWAEAGRKIRRPKGGKDDDGKSDNECRFRKGSELALKQLLLVMVECTTVPVEAIARLGCSCFRWEDVKYDYPLWFFSSISLCRNRHIILTSGPSLSVHEWNVVCLSLCRAAQLTLYPLHQLMCPFNRGTDGFYGDVGDVKVAARRDSCKRETHR